MKILIVRVSSLGDVVHNMPMVADIHRFFPDAAIDWVVEEAYTELVALNGAVRKVIPMALRRWRKSLLRAETRAEIGRFRRQLREEAYDYVFDTQGLFKTGLVMRQARLNVGGRRIGLANATEGSGYEPISRVFHDLSVPVGLRTHAVARARLVAAKALGYAIDNRAPEFNLAAPSTRATSAAWLPTVPYAVFFHGTARAAKLWAQGNWIELARHLQGRGLQVLLPWGSDEEKAAAEQMQQAMPNGVLLPRLPLMEAILLAQRAALVVGLDTGLTHVAAAFLRPTIELYTDSPRWKTEGNWSPNIVNLGEQGSPPDVASVVAAVGSLLD
ncbi:MAG TPA: lipopolysaccharide heptosyltransferase I [Burkholderiaceae bacterium]